MLNSIVDGVEELIIVNLWGQPCFGILLKTSRANCSKRQDQTGAFQSQHPLQKRFYRAIIIIINIIIKQKRNMNKTFLQALNSKIKSITKIRGYFPI